MTFETLVTQTKANMPPRAPLNYMRPKTRDGETKKDEPPRLFITVPTTICGTSKSETFVLQIGSGDHAGKLRITGAKAAKGDGVAPAQMKNAFRFNFGFVPRLGAEVFGDQRLPVRKIDAETFEIDVPTSWFEGDATNE